MLKLRSKTWQLHKRVPKRYAEVEPRTFVWVSLHTDSKTAAAAKADAAWALLIEGAVRGTLLERGRAVV